MTPKKCITDLSDADLRGKRVLVRADLNVPLSPEGKVTSDYRIRESLPTLTYLLERGARVILCSHLGRPKGKPDPAFSLKPVFESLKTLLPGVSVSFVPEVVGPAVTEAVQALVDGSLLLIENVRFEPGETANDPTLSQAFADLADIYVNDAFGAAHRAHASTEGVAHRVSTAVSGLLMNRELTALGQLLHAPARPFVAIVGGSKVSTKIGVLNQLLKQVDTLVIGGGMVFTFLKAQGLGVGGSLVEDDFIDTARALMADAKAAGKQILLPTDIVIADKFAADAQAKTVLVSDIPDGWMGLDLGLESAKAIAETLKASKTVFWNGPLGVFEFEAFAASSRSAAVAIAELTAAKSIVSVLGGGDTIAAIDTFNIPATSYTHVSTGGGATLELMEGKALPGVVALNDKATVPA